ncbi:MAG TPA: single-stranded-DNA-specific exonuclease RecJ [Candidatus Nanopelagicaceae bacterium]|nr:single-stranded-DNA-specific exonuclease RecJ [Candidatus Nanopelagicaceae bacterium]
MERARRRWDLPELGPAPPSEPLLARVLRSRGISDRDFAARDEPVDHDPSLLADMQLAVGLVAEAVATGTQIAVYGDYDADGVTASALLVRAFQSIGIEILAHIPNRESEGYGLNLQALEELAAQGAGLVITVDCGTTALEVAAARPAGMRLLITDHHLAHALPDGAGFQLAPADALVNPQRPDDRYPFKGLAGVGVAYKLVQALEAARIVPPGTASQQLPLVALGTVADMMPLADENRRLVREGLATWAEAAPLGLLALSRGAGIEGAPSSSDLGFSLGPRINAAGRMEDARLALECCLAASPPEAARAAAGLEALNRSRRRSLSEALELARPMVERLPDELAAIVIGDQAFPSGVVGLVAGRLAEEFQRPSFVYSRGGAEWRGSARGAPGLNIVEALASCSGALLRYGGHRSAGGFSVRPESVEQFEQAVVAAVGQQLGSREPCRVFQIDALAELAECNLKTADELAALGPFGNSNPSVLLCATGCRVLATRAFGKSEDHLRVTLDDGSATVEAITFNRPQLRRHLPVGRRIDILFELEVDRWRGRERARLLLRDLRPARL